MNGIIYTAIFIMGTVLGSFYTLAVYRIPLKKDITHERSFCPNCDHKLGFFDLIPILSYLFLGGKCRYCKQKIRPRYFLLEILSGVTFLLFYISLKINIFSLNILSLVDFAFVVFYLSIIFIIAGIEKEKHFIPNSLLIFGFIVSCIYIIYLYIINSSIYKHVIYLILMLLLIILNGIIVKKKNINIYSVQTLALIILLTFFIKEKILAISVIVSIVLGFLKLKINKKTIVKEIPFIFYICIISVALLILNNYLNLII